MASTTHVLISVQCPDPSAAEPVCQVSVSGPYSLLLLLGQEMQQPKGIWEMEVVSHREKVETALLILAVIIISPTQTRFVNVGDQHLFSANE